MRTHEVCLTSSWGHFRFSFPTFKLIVNNRVSHQGNEPESFHQFYSDEDTMIQFGRLTQIFTTLKNYTKVASTFFSQFFSSSILSLWKGCSETERNRAHPCDAPSFPHLWQWHGVLLSGFTFTISESVPTQLRSRLLRPLLILSMKRITSTCLVTICWWPQFLSQASLLGLSTCQDQRLGWLDHYLHCDLLWHAREHAKTMLTITSERAMIILTIQMVQWKWWQYM